MDDSEYVHVQNMAPLGEVAFLDGADSADARVVDQEVDAGLLAADSRDRVPHPLLIGHVHDCVAAAIAAGQDRHVQGIDGRTRSTKARRGRRSDARRPAGDEGHPARVARCHRRPSPVSVTLIALPFRSPPRSEAHNDSAGSMTREPPVSQALEYRTRSEMIFG